MVGLVSAARERCGVLQDLSRVCRKAEDEVLGCLNVYSTVPASLAAGCSVSVCAGLSSCLSLAFSFRAGGRWIKVD